jgi:hypothetical protein
MKKEVTARGNFKDGCGRMLLYYSHVYVIRMLKQILLFNSSFLYAVFRYCFTNLIEVG